MSRVRCEEPDWPCDKPATVLFTRRVLFCGQVWKKERRLCQECADITRNVMVCLGEDEGCEFTPLGKVEDNK